MHDDREFPEDDVLRLGVLDDAAEREVQALPRAREPCRDDGLFVRRRRVRVLAQPRVTRMVR